MIDTTTSGIKKIIAIIKELPRDEYTLSEIVNEEENITFKKLFIDLDRVLNRLTVLCNSKKQFKDISSFAERKSILKKIKIVKDRIKNDNDFLIELDSLKLEIRHFAYIDYTKQYSTDIKTEVDKLRIEKNKVIKEKNELIRAIKAISSNVEKSKINIEQSKDNQNSLKNLGKIIEKYNDQLNQQKIKHKQYNEDIKKYKTEKNNALAEVEKIKKEVEGIKEEAKDAMRLGEASGISAALQAQYDEIKGKKKTGFRSIFNIFIGARAWVFGALLFGIIAIGLGIWLGISGDLQNSIIVARVSLIFISLTGAWFCAGQYVKISNIAADYAYKVSLAKSIVAFSKQLKNDDATDTSYQDYIKKILDEIHQHPLRNYKQQESVAPIEKIIEKVMERISKKNSN
jgi:hypothetical protein